MPVPPLGKAPASRRRRRLSPFDHLEPRRLLTAYVQVSREGAVYRGEPGETTLTRSNSVTATDPSFGHTTTIAWSAAATVSNATVGNPVGVTLAIQAEASASVRYSSNSWYPFVGGTTAGGRAIWSDSFVVADTSILQQSPYVVLTLRTNANFTADPEPYLESTGHSATDYNALIDVTGSQGYYRSGLSGADLPDTFTTNIPVTRGADGLWHGSWQVEANAGAIRANVGRGPMQETNNTAVRASFVSTVTSAAFADGIAPDFSPDKADIVSRGLQWNSEGFTYQYEVKDADLTKDVPIGFFWSADGLTPTNFARSGLLQNANKKQDTHSITVPAREMTVPGPGDRHLIAIADPNGVFAEGNEKNNLSRLRIETTSPNVQLFASPTSPIMGTPFTLTAKVTNTSPMPLKFAITLEEATELSDPPMVGPPVVGDLRNHRILDAFYPGVTREITLGTLTRTWEWIDPQNPVTTIASAIADLFASAGPSPDQPTIFGETWDDTNEYVLENLAEILREGSSKVVASLGAFKDLVEVLVASVHYPTNRTGFRVTVDTTGDRPEDPKGIPMLSGSTFTDVFMAVSDERREAFQDYINALANSKLAMAAAAASVAAFQPIPALISLAAVEGFLTLAHYKYDRALGLVSAETKPPATRSFIRPSPAKFSNSFQFTGPRPANKQMVISLGRKATVASGAFELRAQRGKPIRLNISQSQDASGTVVSLRPRGPKKSLANGVYSLKIRGEGLTDALGRSFDADGDGVEGGSRVQRFRLMNGRIRLL